MININKFSDQFFSIKINFKEYETEIYKTASTAKNLLFYWNDGYTKAFFSEINKEIQSINDLVNSIYRLCSLFISIKTLYNDVNNKQAEFLGIYSNVVNPDNFIIQDGDDSEIATKKKNLYNEVLDIEERIAEIGFHINIPYTKKINFNALSSENSNKDFVGMLGEIDNEINKFNINVQDTTNASNELIESLYDILSYYDSKNKNMIERIINDIEEEITTLNTNLNNAFEFVYNRKKDYKELFDEFATKIKFDN